MKNDVPVKNGIIIPDHEIEITTSRAGGPGGQHVNRTDTRITVRWNVQKTQALNEFQKARVLQNLQTRLTGEGDLIIHDSSSRSQQQNKEAALRRLAIEVSKALYVPKKRMATRVPNAVKKSRLESKKQRGALKKMRRQSYHED
jgi:ribosome-associated protein